MVNVGRNFGNCKPCPFCKLYDDSQEHMFECFVMKLKCPEIFHTNQSYTDIYNLTSKNLINVAQLCEMAIRTRELMMEDTNGNVY